MSQSSVLPVFAPNRPLLACAPRAVSVAASFVAALTLCSGVARAQSAASRAAQAGVPDARGGSAAPASASNENEPAVPVSAPLAPVSNEPQPPPVAPALPSAPVSGATGQRPQAPPSTTTTAQVKLTTPVTTTDAPSHVSSGDRLALGKREGFYLRLASGPSFVALAGDGPSGSASLIGAGSAAMLSLGGSVAPGLIVAGTLQGATLEAKFKGGPFASATVAYNGTSAKASRRATASTGQLGVLIDWYPAPTGGWHTGGSVGVGVTRLENRADESSIAGASLAGTLFGGYDWAIGRQWAIGLQLVVAGATPVTLRHDSGGDDAGYQLTPVSVGVQGSVLYF